MKFYAIAVGFNKETKEHVYNKITINWDEARNLVQGVSRKKDNVLTVYKSCGSLAEAEEYLDGVLAEALEQQLYETPSYEEIVSQRSYPDNAKKGKEEDVVKKEKVKNLEETVKKEDIVMVSVDEIETIIKTDSPLVDSVLTEEKVTEEKVIIQSEHKEDTGFTGVTGDTRIAEDIEETMEEEIVTQTETASNDLLEEEVIEDVVVKEVKKEPTKIESHKQKDSIDLYLVYTYRYYDEKRNLLGYGYTLTKNGVTIKTDAKSEKSKEPTIEGSNLYGSMLAVEASLDAFKRIIPEHENVIIMVYHMEKHLEKTILNEVPCDNGEYFFDWFKLLQEQYPNIKSDFSPILLSFPEKQYIKLQIQVKNLLIN